MLGRHVVRLMLLCCCLLPFSQAIAKKSSLHHAQPAELKQYYDSGKYFQDIARKTAEARDYIDQQLRYSRKGRLAIVLEVDETALSNYPDLEKMAFKQNQQALTDAHMLGNAQPIPQILALYEHALNRNIAVFFVSSRPNTPEIVEATARNLKAAGFDKWEELILMPVDNHKMPVADFKNHARKHISAQGYEILVNIGAQDADLIGGYAEIRVKLPNPFYTVS